MDWIVSIWKGIRIVCGIWVREGGLVTVNRFGEVSTGGW